MKASSTATIRSTQSRSAGGYGVVKAAVAIQVAVWAAAIVLVSGNPALLPMALMAYVLGLRHALDADHIAAIDNVSRSVLGSGGRSSAVGLYFALGHSAAVSATALGISIAASRMGSTHSSAGEWTAIYSTLLSAAVLITVAPRNLVSAWRIARPLLAGRGGSSDSGNGALPPGGTVGRLFNRLLGPLLKSRLRSWQMLLIGALFGLGFETATAIAVMAMSATQAGSGMSILSAMMFPLLFTAGMTLVDSADGLFMERAYLWALTQPKRRAVYNLVITLVSAAIAIGVAVFEVVSLLTRYSSTPFPGAHMLDYVEEHFEQFGAALIAVFAIGWLIAATVNRFASAAAATPRRI